MVKLMLHKNKLLLLYFMLVSLCASFNAYAIDECNNTNECKTLWGDTANDCKNSKSLTSVCMCGTSACATTLPVSKSSASSKSSSVSLPVSSAALSLAASSIAVSSSQVQLVDECNSTAQCKLQWGNSANDCKNSQAPNSICMCGTTACSLLSPGASSLAASSRAASSASVVAISSSASSQPATNNQCLVSGNLKQWHRVELLCSGYAANEASAASFTDLRFDVTFTQGSTRIKVPGHFAADGNAADSGATSGDKWRAYFSPPTTGTWAYAVSFRKGTNIAVSSSETESSAQSPLNGLSGSFAVGNSTAVAPDMRSRGLLQHRAGERYLRFAGDNSVFIEGGMDSPENIFGYSDFDNTTKYTGGSCKGILHDFATHEADWNNGDPSWKNGDGKSLIGLVNYIASHGVNAIYIMMNTVNGDGCDAHPWASYNANGSVKSFDVSKLDQWERVLEHMSAKGIMIHAMTQETENDQLLNGGNLGLERKLYYRELISRFAHHPALQWNLGEENTNTTAQEKSFADFFKQLDPYGHPIALHTFPGEHELRYAGMLGHSTLDGITMQFGGIPEAASAANGVYATTIQWLDRSAAAGNPWYVTFTEASGGDAPTPNTPVTSRQRIYWMYAGVMAGGGGFEWYLKNNGAGHAYDLAVENLREFDQHWQQTGYLVNFFNNILQKDLGINLQNLQRDNNATSTDSDWVLSAGGNSYVVFLRTGGTTNITLPNAGSYSVLWFNPRTGVTTQGTSLAGSGTRALGNPPTETTQDWILVVSK